MGEGQEDQPQRKVSETHVKKEYKKWGRLNSALGIISLASALTYFSAIGHEVATDGEVNPRTSADLADDIQPEDLERYTYSGIEAYRPDAVEKFYRENKDNIATFEALSPEEKKYRLMNSFAQDINTTEGEQTTGGRVVASSLATFLATGVATSASAIARDRKIETQERKSATPLGTKSSTS